MALGTNLTLYAAGPPISLTLNGPLLAFTIQSDGSVGVLNEPASVDPPGPSSNSRVIVKNNFNQSAIVGSQKRVRTRGGALGVMEEESLGPNRELQKVNLQIGSNVTVRVASNSRTMSVQPGLQRITIRSNGTIAAPGEPIPMPTPPTPYGSTQQVTVKNKSNSSVNATFYRPQASRGKLRAVPAGGEVTELNVRVNSQIVLDGSISTQTLNVTGGAPMVVSVTPSGQVVLGEVYVPPSPGPGPIPSWDNKVEVYNATDAPIEALFYDRLREIKPNSSYLARMKPGERVRISGNGATANWVYGGGRQKVRVLPDGQYVDLPRQATVIPNSPPVAEFGHALGANLSKAAVPYALSAPGFAAVNGTLKPNTTGNWNAVPAGTQFTLTTADGQQHAYTVAAGQYISTVVDSAGTVHQMTTSTEHTPPQLQAVVPTPDSDGPNTPNNELVNPDPPSDEPLAEEVPVNVLPTPNTAPLTRRIVSRFSRKTNEESLELVESLLKGSAARLSSIKQSLATAGVDAIVAESMAGAASRGEPEGVTVEVDKLSTDLRSATNDPVKTLRTIALMRQQLLPLERKLSSGAESSDIRSYLKSLENQANNLGDDGLAAAMARIRRDLALRDMLSQGLESSGIGSEQMALPQGEVTYIQHPWITTSNTYFAPSGLMVTGTKGEVIVVSKTHSSAAVSLPVSRDAKAETDLKGQPPRPVVHVSNPESTRSTLVFTMSGKRHSLAAGKSKDFEKGPKYVIEFQKGSSGETAKFNISKPGHYAFTSKEGAWTLVQKKIVAKIENPANETTLLYLVDGEQQSLEPGGTAVHRSKLPMVVQFDAGEGFDNHAKYLKADGTWHFAIDSSTGYWDLFPGPASEIAATGDVLARIERPTLGALQVQCGEELFDFPETDFGEDDLLKNLD